ncbi:MAG: phosphonate metabolism protein/1,5-bisphosphokinase (PRPP-forming) PhnN [Vicinamibacterales bacterium]
MSRDPSIDQGDCEPGCLVFVVGPSGAGKDTLIRGAQARLADDPRIRFVRRAITRPVDGSEDHESVSEAEFVARRDAGDFALSWQAHGLSYGVPVEALRQVQDGHIVVCNGSRAAIAAARSAFPRVRIVLVTAPYDVLQFRIRARNRESNIGDRLARSFPDLADASCDLIIDNSGPASAGIESICGDIQSTAARCCSDA